MGVPTTRSAGPAAHHLPMSAVRITEIDAYTAPFRPGDPLRVTLEGPSGERWSAIGGGDSLADALAYAVASAPAEVKWRVVGWADLFGN
jgi:hypothetical protein